MPDAHATNRSLQRGIEILRAFRPGSDLIGNGELAERTGLPRATVSRLCQTLVECGLLAHESRQRAYRLAAPVLSLAHAMQSGSPILRIARPLMQAQAQRRRINVGLAVADREQMVYLESFRYSQRVAWRNVVAGQRVPMALTSLGRAWLAVSSPAERHPLMTAFRVGRGRDAWRTLSREIGAAMDDVHAIGFCHASWQPQVVALATPIVIEHQPVLVLNMSVAGAGEAKPVVDRLGAPLLALARQLRDALAAV